jgi:hypothetical protein
MPLALVEHISLRHRYIFEFIFNDVLGLPNFLTENRSEFRSSFGPKICYSAEPEEGAVNVFPSALLSETGLHNEIPAHTEYQGMPCLFPVKPGADLPFDPFAMAFYILSRMEEYLPFEADEHGRFTEKNSIQYKLGLLHEPVVNRLAFMVLEILQKKFPQLVPEVNYSFLPTIDVDIAFAHIGKDPLRAAGGFAKLLLRSDFGGLGQRLQTIRGKMKDPYDNFDLHQDLAEEYNTGLIYFFLLGNYGEYDKMLSYRNRRMRELVRDIASEVETGIHPSYASFGKVDKIKSEITRLEGITHEPVTRHRAHFLRIRFPDSFRNLVKLGITDDYSLGYSAVNGFRAGTSTPFFFYDLLKEEISGLKLHPFITMDSAFIDHLNLTPEEALAEASQLIEKVKKWGGEAIGIWHNYSLCEQGQYTGWQQFFKDTMAMASK